MQIVMSDALEKEMSNLEAFRKALPEKRKAALELISQRLLSAVQEKIGGSGKVQGWQEGAVGSKGYYAAVRPKAKTFVRTQSGRKYAVGYITNAITSGHRIRPPGGRSDRYEPRIDSGRMFVPGKQFYAQVNNTAEAVASAAIDEMMDDLLEILESD